MIRRLGLVVLGVSLLGSPAWANPMSVDAFRVQQVPHTQHVQVTYGVMTGQTLTSPASLDRDSTSVSPSWTTYAGYTANTGSGLTALDAVQWCDCDVAVGAHSYTAVVTGSGTLEADVTVVADLAYPTDAGVVPADAEPWDIPEPVGIQGLGCSQMCGAGGPDAGVPDAGPTPDAGTDPPDKDDGGGCSFAGSSTGITIVGLWMGLSLLLMVVLAIRRRRR